MRTASQVINLVSQFLPSKAVRRSAIYDRELFLPGLCYTWSRGLANYTKSCARGAPPRSRSRAQKINSGFPVQVAFPKPARPGRSIGGLRGDRYAAAGLILKGERTNSACNQFPLDRKSRNARLLTPLTTESRNNPRRRRIANSLASVRAA